MDTNATVTIATGKTQVSAIHNQLGEDVGISVELCRCNIFPAIELATAYLVDVAEQYTAQGELWNGGVFAYKLGYL